MRLPRRRAAMVGEDPPDAAAGEWAVRAYDLWKVYRQGEDDVHACAGMTLGVRRGEFVAIMGPSGSGKTTLVQLLAGLDRPTSGRVFLGDDEITHLPEKRLTRLRRDRVGFVFQSFNLVSYLTAEQNIRLPQRLGGAPVDDALFRRVVDRLGIGDRLDHLPGQLSGGQQQRVALGRALLAEPDLLVGDEPTGNLDLAASGEVLRLLAAAVAELGRSVVVVTHDPGVAAHATRTVFVADGRIVDELTAPTLDSIVERQKQMVA